MSNTEETILFLFLLLWWFSLRATICAAASITRRAGISSASEDEEELVEEAEDDLEEPSSASLSSEEDEVDFSSRSDEESLAELSLLLPLELVTLLDLFFLVFLSTVVSPMLSCNNNLFSFSFKAFFSSAVFFF